MPYKTPVTKVTAMFAPAPMPGKKSVVEKKKVIAPKGKTPVPPAKGAPKPPMPPMKKK